jgi:hypothetical protein
VRFVVASTVFSVVLSLGVSVWLAGPCRVLVDDGRVDLYAGVCLNPLVRQTDGVEEPKGVTLVEHFILEASDGGVLLWELAAGWAGSGDKGRCVGAVPVLLEALVSLSRWGAVVVRGVRGFPLDREETEPIGADQLPDVIGDVEKWLSGGEDTSMVTVSLTDTGARWL